MYRTASGEEIFVIDSHVHFWDASPENIKNRYGQGWIDCFYDYHKNLSPAEEVWTKEKYAKYPENGMLKDLFEDGHVDMAIFQPTYLSDFFHNSFGPVERSAIVAERNPDRFILNGAFDPRDGERGLEYLHSQKERYNIRGVKLYTAEWRGQSKGYKLSDPEAYKFLERCEELGIINIHVHKGPTIWPLNRDSFDVHDVDDAATAFPNLKFIVEHCGLPRLEDFCWIGTQEKNVYGGLAVVMPFINARPRYFGHVMAELLFWLGPDKLLFSSDYALWKPGWLVEKFMAFEIPEDIAQETGVQLTLETKKMILGENAARLYDIDIEAKKKQLAGLQLVQA
jgi:predicted TIM-barrel fold metal-dependent hydrolase